MYKINSYGIGVFGVFKLLAEVCSYMKKDFLVLLNQLDDGNLASDVSTRCSGRPQSIWLKRRKLSYWDCAFHG